MAYEADLWRNWIPLCSAAEVVAAPEPLERITYCQFDLPMLRRGLSAIVGVASRRRAARAVADIGDRNRLRAALSVWTRRHSPRGVSFNLNV